MLVARRLLTQFQSLGFGLGLTLNGLGVEESSK